MKSMSRKAQPLLVPIWEDGEFSLTKQSDSNGTVFGYNDGYNGYYMSMNVTSEGVIWDVWEVDNDGNDIHRATRAQLWDEILDTLIAEQGPDPRYEGSLD